MKKFISNIGNRIKSTKTYKEIVEWDTAQKWIAIPVMIIFAPIILLVVLAYETLVN